MLGFLTSQSERLAAATAKGVTRRRMLRNVGGVALGATVGSAYLGTRPDVAEACAYWASCGTSPRCADFRCRSAAGLTYECNAGRADTAWRNYNTSQCGGGGPINCWTVCNSGRRVRCCDCAGQNTAGGCGFVVSGCGSGTWRSCICAAQIGSC
jgi:hypothetical protein